LDKSGCTPEELHAARKVLGISISATPANARKKYKELVRKWHPDINTTQEAHKKIREINHAYELIMKHEFNAADALHEYSRLWFKQCKNDWLCGGGFGEKRNRKNSASAIDYRKTSAAKKKQRSKQ